MQKQFLGWKIAFSTVVVLEQMGIIGKKKKKSYKNQLQMDQGLKQKTVIKLLGKNLEENLQWAKSS